MKGIATAWIVQQNQYSIISSQIGIENGRRFIFGREATLTVNLRPYIFIYIRLFIRPLWQLLNERPLENYLGAKRPLQIALYVRPSVNMIISLSLIEHLS